MGRTVTQPYLHVCDNSPIQYNSYYGHYMDQYGSTNLYLAKLSIAYATLKILNLMLCLMSKEAI